MWDDIEIREPTAEKNFETASERSLKNNKISENIENNKQVPSKLEDGSKVVWVKNEITEELIMEGESDYIQNQSKQERQLKKFPGTNVYTETEFIAGPSAAETSEAAINATGNLLPLKSKEVYENYYAQFVTWQRIKNVSSFSENVILAYFSEISNKMKPSTLWKIYSMLRSTISLKHNINIANYAKLRAFLKRKSDGYQAKKSKTLTTEEMKRFIDEAPDEIYLATKVASIVGIMGACRKFELWKMKIEHIEDLGAAILIRVPDTKTKVERKFTIPGRFCKILKKYLALRPANASSNNFFLNYQKGRCTNQVIGIHKFGDMPKQIARFLQLQNPEQYTGHCFKRTSATMLVDAGGDICNYFKKTWWLDVH